MYGCQCFKEAGDMFSIQMLIAMRVHLGLLYFRAFYFEVLPRQRLFAKYLETLRTLFAVIYK